MLRFGGFVTYKQVEPAIAIEIIPDSRLTGAIRQHLCLDGYIGECAVAIIPDQGVGLFAES